MQHRGWLMANRCLKLVCAFLPVLVACATEGPIGADGQRVSGCFTSCEQAGAECGRLPDLCGGVLECGYCTLGKVCGGGGEANLCGDEPCVPRSCEANECGSVSDGCGDVMECKPEGCANGYECEASRCTCAKDSEEPNDTVGKPAELGNLDTSGGRQELKQSDLTLSGTDIDRFQLAVKNTGLVTDPLVTPWLRVRLVAKDDSLDSRFHIGVYYAYCPDPKHECSDNTTPADDKKGCEGTSIRSEEEIWLKANCKGPDDSGKATIRVQLDCGDRQGCSDECHPYDLVYSVEPYRDILRIPY